MTRLPSHTFHQQILTVLLLSVLIGIMGCRLEDKSVRADIYPTNGATDVPVNTIIEVHFPKELGLTDKDIPENAFTIHECTVATFDYMNKNAKKDAPPATENPEKTADNAETKSTETKSNAEEDSLEDGTTLIQEVKFYFKNTMDAKSGIVFNYLVVKPVNQETPLKPNTTYCVNVQEIENKAGVVIKGRQTSFTTKKARNFRFDPKPEGTIFADDISPSIKTQEGTVAKKDYILIYFNTHISPELLKKSITLCKALNIDGSYVSEQCNDFKGKVIPSNIYLIESLVTNKKNQLIPGQYNLFAITTREGFEANQTYKIILNMDSINGEGNLLYNELEFTTLNTPTEKFSFERFYQDEIKDSSDKSIATKIYQQFFIGSGMNRGTSSTSDNELAQSIE